MLEMLKVILILSIGLVLQAVGVVLVSQGVHEVGEMKRICAAEIGRLIVRGATNAHFLLGILSLVLFFACLLYLLARQTVSLVWSLTSLSMVITVLAARFIGHEEVTPLRWGGVALIIAGAALVAWSEPDQNLEPISYEKESPEAGP